MLDQTGPVSRRLRGLRARRHPNRSSYPPACPVPGTPLTRLKRHIEKGNDLLEEAASLGESAAAQDNVGGSVRELARSLQSHLRGFTERLEDTRERLEDTSQCYQLLDKAYEWALEAMRFVSRLRLEENPTSDQLGHVLQQLSAYLEKYPPLSSDMFIEMNQLANKLCNDKLIEQCKVAVTRCHETQELIRTRQTALLRAKHQLNGDYKASNFDLAMDTLSDSESLGPLSPLSAGSPAGPLSPMSPMSPRSCSSPWTPSYQFGRRRSLGAIPSGRTNMFNFGYSSLYKESLRPDPSEESSVDCGYSSDLASPQPAAPPAATDTVPAALREPRKSLHDIKELRESAEDLLEDHKKDQDLEERRKEAEQRLQSLKVGDVECASVSSSECSIRRPIRPMLRANTWDYTADTRQPCPLQRRGSQSSSSTGTDDVNSKDYSEESSTEADDSLESRQPLLPFSGNSHLLSPGDSGVDTTDMSQVKRTQVMIMQEMIQTERDYVRSLEYTIENYIPELFREDIPQALRGQRNVIFGNIEKVYEFHALHFLRELEKCQRDPFKVGQAFLKHEPQFYLYALYNKNKPKSDSLLSSSGNTFFKDKQLELGDKMDVASYLLKPVQRMGKYSLLLKQLLKLCKPADPHYQHLHAAESMVRFQLRHGNDLLAMDSLRDCDVNLKEQGRLLRQDEFLVTIGNKGKKHLRQVFLFEDLILFSKAKRDPERKNLELYFYKYSLKLTDIGMTEQIGESPYKFDIWFRKRTSHGTYMFQAANSQVKGAWTEEIRKILWKQAVKNRENRMLEMNDMGIGNKPCLNIKHSGDQIVDRSININQLAKAPRFRNSISGPSPDLTQCSAKRPYSIISVSSSSSGSSSSSCSGTPGSYPNSSYGIPPPCSTPTYSCSGASTYHGMPQVNLAFDPRDSPSPRALHRSVTIHSQYSTESGVASDRSYCEEAEHNRVERSNSTVTNVSSDSAIGLMTPLSPAECITPEESLCGDSLQHQDRLVSEL